MPDITLTMAGHEFEYDINIANGDIATGQDLETAVIISLFTWRRAESQDDVPQGSPKYGWWGDQLADDIQHKTGSRLWLMLRRKLTRQTINDAVEYMKQSLQWMIKDGVAGSIDVTAERNGLYEMDALIKIYRNGGQPAELRYSELWQALLGGGNGNTTN